MRNAKYNLQVVHRLAPSQPRLDLLAQPLRVPFTRPQLVEEMALGIFASSFEVRIKGVIRTHDLEIAFEHQQGLAHTLDDDVGVRARLFGRLARLFDIAIELS